MRERSENERKITPLRIGVFIFCAAAACFSFSYFLYIVISGNDPYNKLMTSLLLTVMYLLPFGAHLLFKDKVSDFVITFYTAFLTVASLLGQLLRFNHHFPWYDKFCQLSDTSERWRGSLSCASSPITKSSVLPSFSSSRSAFR